MDPTPFLLGAAAAGTVLLLLVAWLAGRLPQLRRWREAEQALAMAQAGLARIPELIEQLAGAVAAQEQARSGQAAAMAEQARTGVALELTTQQLGQAQAQLARHAAARLEEQLAAARAELGSTQNAVRRLDMQLESVERAREALTAERGSVAAELAAMTERLGQERSQADAKLALVTHAREQMTLVFHRLAADVMEQHGSTFRRQNGEQIEALLAPLRERIGDFQAGLHTAHTETAAERAALGEQIRHMLAQSDRMTAETTNLTRALRGSSQVQGAWGEMVLASVLQRSGLVEGLNYVLQQSVTDSDGRRLRPDAVVMLPNLPHLVIDSKVSLSAFEAHVNAEADSERHAHLSVHARSLRSHVASLGRKDYHAVTGSELDYVVMFVPIEAALAAALAHDPALTDFAIDRGVTIATPSTLMVALRTIANVWRVDKRNKNAEAIAAEAGQLYDKLAGFVADMQSLGAQLGRAQITYDDAMRKLSTGQGNALARAERLKQQGAKTAKALPPSLLDGDAVALLAEAAESL